MNTTDETASMLAEVRAANAELSRRAVAPLWYHPALGLLCGGAVAIHAAPIGARLVYMLAFGLGLILLVKAYRRKTGLWVSGFRRGRTRWLTFSMVPVAMGTLWLTSWLEWERGVQGAFLIGGAGLAVLTTAYGFAWEALFRRDMREGGSL